MRRWWLGLVIATAALPSSPAEARTVLCFGDSTSWFYPARLRALRRDLTVVGGARLGDVSTSLPRLAALLAAHRPSDVVIMIGTNDVARRPDRRPAVTDDPAITFRNTAGSRCWHGDGARASSSSPRRPRRAPPVVLGSTTRARSRTA